MKEKKMPKRHGPSWQTILLIVAGAVLWMGLGMLMNTDGGNSGNYSRYAGPVLPLTAVSGGERLEVQRHVDFNFALYEDYVPTSISEGETIITDTYQLANPTDTDTTVRLVYPYEGRFEDERKYTPTITVNGQDANGRIVASVDEGQTVFRARDFKEYQDLIAGNDFYAQAIMEPPKVDVPVKVYHFTDITYQGDLDYPYIFLTVEFKIPEGANVWVNHFDVLSSGSEKDSYTVWFQDDLDERDGAYLFVMGGDVENLAFGGNLGHNVTETSGLTNVTCEYETYETTFEELIWKLAQQYDYWAVHDDAPNPGLLTPEILYRDAMKRMEDKVGKAYDGITWGISVVEDSFYEAVAEMRLLYWVFDVTIPAGETIEVEAVYHQEASTDIGGPKKRREGYDLATRLGSNLHFASQSASITGGEFIEILRQNFGFNLKKNITKVKLDLKEERYYMDIAVKET